MVNADLIFFFNLPVPRGTSTVMEEGKTLIYNQFLFNTFNVAVPPFRLILWYSTVLMCLGLNTFLISVWFLLLSPANSLFIFSHGLVTYLSKTSFRIFLGS